MNAATDGSSGNEAGHAVPGPGSDPWQVMAADIANLRRHVNATARRAGLDADRADRYTFAVNEIVINAIQHGGGRAEVAVVHSDGTDPGTGAEGDTGTVTVIVLDHGPGWNSRIPDDLPPSDQAHGRGLWLAHRMCDDLTISSSPTGTTITLRAAARPA